MKKIIRQKKLHGMSSSAHAATKAPDRATGHQAWCHNANHNPERTHCHTEASEVTDGVLYLSTREVGTVERPAVVSELPDWMPVHEGEDVAIEILRLTHLAAGSPDDGVGTLIDALHARLEERQVRRLNEQAERLNGGQRVVLVGEAARS